MKFDVAINGRTRRVEVERASGRYHVLVDGRRHAADVTVINGVWSLILEPPDGTPGPRRSFEVAVVEHPPRSGNLTVHVDGRVIPVAISTSRAPQAGRGADVRASGNGPQSVTAPMPGRVVKVLVQPGDTVTARQGVVVVEAMKMENELRAPRAGKVAEVKVSEGMSVEAGATLAVIE